MNPFERNWLDIFYLRDGNARQQSVYTLLAGQRIFDKLKRFTPVLCGTIPIDCDIDSSDLDIICHAENLADFSSTLVRSFSAHRQFNLQKKQLSGVDSIVAKFLLDDWKLEVVGQPVPVIHQRAYGHMLAEAALIFQGDKTLPEKIRNMKQDGMTTEEAFAAALDLPGNPYEILMKMYYREYNIPDPQ